MIPGLDGGPIFYQETIEITPEDTITTLYDRLNAIQRREMAGAVNRLLAGEEGTVQAENLATYCCTRLPEDGQIDWKNGDGRDRSTGSRTGASVSRRFHMVRRTPVEHLVSQTHC
jgi:methionyl-tRNA formyltransferase